ncbi:antibiotic synthesis protein MbtH [Streptomyces sp. PRh5]|uniref:MbtH family protein n=2 Tax=Streptomyces TaxID=1883 RepID=UPI00045087CD|nr:MbtH family NRPS accessory protein [Streptomyces sp. PRh5]EXU64830.1 antibiotic synthesis protein MbtH [Streptomyces sp. PRh5]
MSEGEQGKIEYKVVINAEEQHSIWPLDRENPLGWESVGVSGSKEHCLEHIRKVWTDIRPLSVRKRMQDGS